MVFCGAFLFICLETLPEMKVSSCFSKHRKRWAWFADIGNVFQSFSNLGILWGRNNHESQTLVINQMETVRSCKFALDNLPFLLYWSYFFLCFNLLRLNASGPYWQCPYQFFLSLLHSLNHSNMNRFSQITQWLQ